MPSCPKIAIIGTGLIGPRHADAVLNNNDAELACIVDPNPAAEAVAHNLDCPWYKSVDDMLASPSRPDAALVCTPNHTHVAISKTVLKGGVHVLCEKPISVDVASGQELDTIVASTGKVIAVSGLWTNYKPSGYFDSPTEWRRLKTAGPILINLIHEIDNLYFWFGPIIRVFAEQTISQRGHEAEEGAAVTLRFSNGIVGTFILSEAVVSPHNFESGTGENPIKPKQDRDCYRIFGSAGSLSFPDMTRWTYPGQWSWNEPLHFEHADVPETRVPVELQIEHFVKVIKGDEEPSCTDHDGLRAVAVCEAIRKSMKEKIPVDISTEA